MSLAYLEILPGGKRIAPDTAVNSESGTLLHARYDLARIKQEFRRDDIARGPSSLWRYASLLPVRDPKNVVTLGEGWTPLIRASRLAQAIGCENLWIKDEGRNPSGTFKDRGAAVALSRYRELGVKSVALNSSGNAGGSWALYAARAGIECAAILPTDAQPSSRRHCELGGARTYYVENWHDAGKIVADACAKHGWFNVNTLKEPYRAEGKKTMGLEIVEQLGWRLPDVVICPMGGGLGAIAIWKAFEELVELDWVRGRMPEARRDPVRGLCARSEGFRRRPGRGGAVGQARCASRWAEIAEPAGGEGGARDTQEARRRGDRSDGRGGDPRSRCDRAVRGYLHMSGKRDCDCRAAQGARARHRESRRVHRRDIDRFGAEVDPDAAGTAGTADRLGG